MANFRPLRVWLTEIGSLIFYRTTLIEQSTVYLTLEGTIIAIILYHNIFC